MISQLFVALLALMILLILFLVIGKTLNGIVNQLLKIHYCVTRELEYRREELHIRLILEEAEAQQARMKDELFTGPKKKN